MENGELEKAAELIEELELKDISAAETYEKCETVGRLAPSDVVSLIEDSETREGVEWVKSAHKKIPANTRWRKAFARTIQKLFDKVGGLENIKKWHELEGLCENISEGELGDIDEDLKEAIGRVQKIHDRSPDRRIEITKKINEEVEDTQ